MTKKRLFFLGSLAAPLLLAAIFLAVNALSGDILRGVPFSAAFLDRNGGLMRVFLSADEKYRIFTPVGDFPPELIEAVLLQEDRYFYGHFGVNPGAVLRAARETWILKTRRVGASTLTMQVARMRYGLHTRSVPGKIGQILRALYLEICFGKQEILEAYLNLAPCGGNIEGFPAAARYYFGVDVKDLSTSEILFLAVIPQNPNDRSPRGGRAPSGTLNARSVLFDSWLETHPEDAIISAEIENAPALVCSFPSEARHFCESLKADGATMAKRGRSRRDGRNIRRAVRTTVDPRLQELCEDHLRAYLERNRGFGVTNGSMMLIDRTSMEVLSSIGSADYFDDRIQGQVNGTTARRSPGSTLKPFIYALAVEQGLIHPETMLKDTPVTFSEYAPDNFKDDYKGPIKAWDALVDSRNIPAVFLARAIKDPDLYDLMKKAGVGAMRGRDHYGLSIVLGSAGVTMVELVQLYAALANGGRHEPVRTYADRDATGRDATSRDATGRGEPHVTLVSESAAWITMRMLERNPPPVAYRPQTSVATPVAWKTGTSIGFKDSWAVAVFDRYVLCVWIGNFSGEGNTAFIGRYMSGPLLFGVIDAMLSDIPEELCLPPPRIPADVASVSVCAVSGGIPNEHCPHTVRTWFLPGVSPITKCGIHRAVRIDTRTGYRTDETGKGWIREEVREFWPSDLMELFEEAGLPRLKPPPYPPTESSFDARASGFPPSIISPMANTEYVLRRERSRYNQLVLQASADSDAGKLFWFADSAFLGSAEGREKIIWSPDAGSWTVTVVDSRGRSASIRVVVTEESE